ncbi:MAG: c-type cytochrome [Pseudobdellovibrio sp.]
MSEQKDFHNQAGLIAFLGSITFVLAFFFYIVAVNKGVDLAENVTAPAKAGEAQFDLSSVKEPWVSSDEVVQAGAKLYKQNCAMCHGQKGDVVGGTPGARDLVAGQWKMGSGSIAHFKVLQNGIPGTAMVSFKAQLKPYERWALVHFIDSITNNKSTDKPEDVANFAKSAEAN